MARFVPAASFDIVIFGGTGDLAQRKLLPALYHRDRDGQISSDSRIIGVSRQVMSSDAFRTVVRNALEEHLPAGEFTTDLWQRFEQRLEYVQIELGGQGDWARLAELLQPERIRVFYLATLPCLYGDAAEAIDAHGLVTERARIVLEKPVGEDLETAVRINARVGAVFSEQQIYRIDHYLGKETVQNLLALRFANSLFEPLWHRTHIDHVQITVAESLGVGHRGAFYEDIGALKDIVQNHLLQLVCLVAMEPPTSLDPEQMRDEKIKVLKALRPIDLENVEALTVRGQYTAGTVQGRQVAAYSDEIGAASDRETFVAIKAHIENWRWAGVPFYLRTGKRMPRKASEIVIQFRPVTHSVFTPDAGRLIPNRMVIRLQPNEGVTLSLMSKDPGPGGFFLRSLPLDLSFAEQFDARYPDAYERLLMEVVRGNPALFMRRDEVEAAWHWIDRILVAWQQTGQPAYPYQAGTTGPVRAETMLDRDGHEWHV